MSTNINLLSYVILIIFSATLSVSAGRLIRYDSQYYSFWSDTDSQYGNIIACHLDLIYRTYSSPGRAIPLREPDKTEVFVFVNRSDFITFASLRMKSKSNLTNVTGLFGTDCVTNRRCIATFIEDDERLTRVLGTLQHECAHDFFLGISGNGPYLPGWISEGGPEYFSQMVYTPNDDLMLGIVPGDKLRSVATAIKSSQYIALPLLLKHPASDFDTAYQVFYYQEAWSLYHYFYHAHNGQLRNKFIQYVNQLKYATDSTTLLENTFNCSIADLEQEWKKYILQLQPDVMPEDIIRLSEYYYRNDQTITNITITPISWQQQYNPILFKLTYRQDSPPDVDAYSNNYFIKLKWVVEHGRKLWSVIYFPYQ